MNILKQQSRHAHACEEQHLFRVKLFILFSFSPRARFPFYLNFSLSNLHCENIAWLLCRSCTDGNRSPAENVVESINVPLFTLKSWISHACSFIIRLKRFGHGTLKMLF